MKTTNCKILYIALIAIISLYILFPIKLVRTARVSGIKFVPTTYGMLSDKDIIDYCEGNLDIADSSKFYPQKYSILIESSGFDESTEIICSSEQYKQLKDKYAS